jgi:sigma-B regulation protein RsbU (phosphoserine phosphatase)
MDIAGISIASRFACGDYYDFLPTDDGSLVVVVADVAGHGIGPALQMVGVRASLRAIAATEHDPGKCLSRLNRVLSPDLPDETFVTMLIARIERLGKSLSYSAAGHEALLVRSDGQATRLNSTGLVLGPVEATHFDLSASIPLEPGDVILIPTDGLIETMSPDRELFGWDRAADVIRAHRHESAMSIVDELRQAANRFSNGAVLQDDVTAVVVKILSDSFNTPA